MTPDVEMARIPCGSVTLHDARRRARRTVALEPFEIGVYAVTEELMADLIGVPSGHPRRPAVHVSWQRAIRFCNALSEWEGLEPAYRWDGEQAAWDATSDGYRLPTEAEWEFACRAGSSRPQYGPLADVAWTRADHVSHPQDVGGKMPNLYGLFDTLGNVWEWCWDLLDPAGTDARVFRGGGYGDDGAGVGAAVRAGDRPRTTHDDVGLRVARGSFDDPDSAQGWSVALDAENAVSSDRVLAGWTAAAR